MVLAGFYMLCRMMTTKELLINRACVVQDYKPVTYALLPNQRVHLQFYRETLLEQHRNSELKTRSTQPQHGCSSFLLIKGTCAQTQYKIHIFYQPFDLSNIEFGQSLSTSKTLSRISSVNLKPLLAKKARAVHQWNQSRECSTMALSSSVCY
jgi:hypothetical protein